MVRGKHSALIKTALLLAVLINLWYLSTLELPGVSSIKLQIPGFSNISAPYNDIVPEYLATSSIAAVGPMATASGHSDVISEDNKSEDNENEPGNDSKTETIDVKETEEFVEIEQLLNQTLSEYESIRQESERLREALKATELEKEKQKAEEEEKQKKEGEKKKQEEEKKKQEEEKKKQKEEEDKKKEEEEKKEREEKEKAFRAPYEAMLKAQIQEEYLLVNKTPSFPGYNGHLEPSGHKIAILSGYDNGGSVSKYPEITQMAMLNREEYARYHGYIHQFINFTDVKTEQDYKGTKAVWYKLRAIVKTFELHPEVEWVWWLDTDVIIMNPELDLAHHILNERVMLQRLSYGQPLIDIYGKVNGLVYPQQGQVDYNKLDLIIAQDDLGLNAGSFLIRRSEFIFWLLDFWYDPVFLDKHYPRDEQGCLIHLMNHHKYFRERVGLVPQRLINAFDWTYGTSQKVFQDGDFLVHFAGRGSHGDYLDTWDRYWTRRRLLPEEARLAPVDTLNPDRLPDCVKDVKLTDEEKKLIKTGGKTFDELLEIFGDRMSNADVDKLHMYMPDKPKTDSDSEDLEESAKDRQEITKEEFYELVKGKLSKEMLDDIFHNIPAAGKAKEEEEKKEKEKEEEKKKKEEEEKKKEEDKKSEEKSEEKFEEKPEEQSEEKS